MRSHPPNPVRVLFVDDDPLIREAFAVYMSSSEDVTLVGTASDGLDALHQVYALRPNVVLMDISMPKMSGIEATKMVVKEFSDVKVVIFSGQVGWEYMRLARAAGASGFLTKGCLPTDIIDAIRRVNAGGTAWTINGDSH